MSALVVYDGPSDSGDGLITARYVANLLGHFGIKPDISPLASYSPGSCDRYGATFVCGMAPGTTVPASLVRDVADTSRPVCWINRHVKQLLALEGQTGRLGFEFVDYLDDADYESIGYRGISLPKQDGEINLIRITDPGRAHVLATAAGGDDSTPYAVRSGSFWYFADSIFAYNSESDRSLVFADLLHDLLGQEHAAQKTALVRIEDVSADSDPRDLRRIADVLHKRGIPFQIALIPIFRNPARRVELYLSDEPDVADAVRYMVRQGGQVVLHGVTHQLHGESGDDFEFWDTLTEKATPDANPASIDRKIETGIEECFRAGLYPVAWETPHYTASLAHYRELSRIFSHAYERRMVTDENGTQQYFPYQAEDWMGQSVIPENLGYVNGDKPDPEAIVQAADRLLAVRDGVASFFFHPFLESRYLETALDGIDRDGYRFASITQFGCRVSLSDYAVATSNFSMSAPALHPYLKKTMLDSRGNATEEVEQVDSEQPVSLVAPHDGVIAAEGVARPPSKSSGHGLVARVLSLFTNDPHPGSIPPSRRRSRQVLVVQSPPSDQRSLQDRLDLQGFDAFLQSYGISHSRLELPEHDDAKQDQLLAGRLNGDSLLIITRTAAASLGIPAEQRIAAWVESGGCAVIEGRSRLAERLGFSFKSRSDQVSHVRDTLFSDVPITWSESQEIPRFDAPVMTQTLVESEESHTPVAVASRDNEGTVIFLAADLDPRTGLGYARYPYLFHHLAQRFGLASPARRSGAEFYFDPGYREQAPIERLVQSWRRDGIRAVYAAAWHFYPRWSYDYDTLIMKCHEQGIAVYAWFELPQVSDKFWEDHPEWREKTATGHDGDVGWRKLMNLADDDCRAAAMSFVSDLLESHDWDGVNIAELGFDTSDGLKQPDGYVPMNHVVRDRFQQEQGFDPILILDPKSAYHWQKNLAASEKWEKFRSGLVRTWLIDLLDRIEPLRSARQFDVICTALDSLNLPRVIEKTGADIRDVLSLMDRYGFTLQVEDPAVAWGATPIRYSDYGRTYRKLVSDSSRLMFDINVVRDPSRTGAPTEVLSGTELALAVRSAAEAGNGRVGIYSEASVGAEDRALLPMVLAGPVEFKTASQDQEARIPLDFPNQERLQDLALPATIRLRLGVEAAKDGATTAGSPGPGRLPVLDGEVWHCGSDGEIIVPCGRHRLGGRPKEESVLDRLREVGSGTSVLKDITAEVTSAHGTPLGLEISYQSPRRAWAMLARNPVLINIDGSLVKRPDISHSRGEWLLTLPAGNHRVEIDDETVQFAAVQAASAVSSRTIVWFGEYFVIALLTIYVGVLGGRLRTRLFVRARRQCTIATHLAAGVTTGPLRVPAARTGPLTQAQEGMGE